MTSVSQARGVVGSNLGLGLASVLGEVLGLILSWAHSMVLTGSGLKQFSAVWKGMEAVQDATLQCRCHIGRGTSICWKAAWLPASTCW